MKLQEIIISKKEDNRIIALVENGNLQEVYEESNNKVRLEGNIYLGIVKDVLPGMQAGFVDIGEEKNAFIHIKDVIPKMSNITGNKNEDFEKYKISDYIKQNQKILVEVKKDSNTNKGARVTTHIHIPGRFVVLMPENEFITVSQKIESQAERERLTKIVKTYNKNMGIIIRTAANGQNEEKIKNDIEEVIKKWEEIQKKVKKCKDVDEPQVILQSDSIIEKILLDLLDNGLNKIILNDKELYEKINNDIIQKNPKIKVEYKDAYLLKMYDLEEQIENAKARKIWLKCGGFITIDKTEALVAIDVNSGKFTGNTKSEASLERTILKVNEEASVEIAKQLRLKDIGGIIIIDYIDMQEEASKKKVIETLQKSLKADRAKTQIMEFTKLNLLEMTRKHIFSN